MAIFRFFNAEIFFLDIILLGIFWLKSLESKPARYFQDSLLNCITQKRVAQIYIKFSLQKLYSAEKMHCTQVNCFART